MSSTLILASANSGKIREFKALLAPLGYHVETQAQYHIEPIAEIHHTFIENALLKARHAAQITGLPALADDSGICVPALNGAPGVYSARYAQMRSSTLSNDENNNQQLITDLKNINDRRAYYYCVLVLMRHENDPQPIVAQGRWHGEIIEQARGQNGFGYDPHFWLAEFNKTAAELLPEEKNQISHRAQVIRDLLNQLGQV